MNEAARYSLYPMHKLRRVDSPTVRILGKVDQVREDEHGYNRAVRGDFGPVVQRERPRFCTKYPLSGAMRNMTGNMAPFVDGPVAADRAPIPASPQVLSEHVRRLGYFLRADIVGICRLPQYAVYSHDGHGNEIRLKHKYAILLVMDQDWDTMDRSSGHDWISCAQSYRGYSFAAYSACMMADYIRRLGYPARAHHARDYQVLIPPLLLWAGIGEHCRLGDSVLNPFIGTRFKASAVTTDLPLLPDRPVDFGLQAFCAQCGRCAEECPSKAITPGGKTVYNGYEVWKMDTERCTRFRLTNQRGASCGRCIKVCPWNKPQGVLHDAVRFMVKRAAPLDRLLVRMDRVFYPEKQDPAHWWFDLEEKDGVVQVPRSSGAVWAEPGS
jgi:3-chloro-4-hydroxyphenylacetate reductive dehalogenase